jgi:hypothetical protein
MLLLVQRHKSHLLLLLISFQTKKKRQSFDWRFEDLSAGYKTQKPHNNCEAFLYEDKLSII